MMRTLHPFIRQLFAEGYRVGDRVVGRCLEVVPDGVDKGNAIDWWATLTDDNLNLTEYRWRSGGIEPNGANHPDGLSWLRQQNESHFGIYYNINAGRKNRDVERFFTIAWEDDKSDFDTQQAKIDAFPLAPTTVVRTNRSKHTKYRIVESECDKSQWASIQEEMSLTMASDPAIKDLPRLMRCAGFNHVKWGDGSYKFTPCELEVSEPERIYTLDQIRSAMAQFAPQPFSKLRYRAYNFAIGKLNQRKSGIPYPLIDPELFRTCDENELEEKFVRLRLYARLCEQAHKGTGDGTDPAVAWTMPLTQTRKRYRQEVEVDTVAATPEQIDSLDDANEHLVLRWARLYGIGWKRAGSGGRSAWDTCRCPVHGSSSNSGDNLHINRFDPAYKIGAISCKSGCDTKEIIKAFRQLAKDANDPTWNWSLKRGDNEPKNNIVSYRTEDESKAIEEAQKKIRSFTYPANIEINERYIPRNLWAQLPTKGILNLRAPKGSGKSELIKSLIARAKREGRPVITITPRITLGEEQAVRWDIYYIDSVPVKFTIENVPTLGLCWDSLAKLLGKDLTNALVIIDEAELGLMHLVTSGTCEDNRPKILAAFQTIEQSVLASNGLIVLSDADLTDVSVDYVRSLAPNDTPIFTVTNTHKGFGCKVRFATGDRYLLERWVIASINAGRKFAIALDSQKEAEQLHELMSRECPGKRIIRIDSKTSRTERVKNFLQRINQEILREEPDVLLYTPSMGVGVSIDAVWFDEVVGFFFGKLEPSQCRQMLARVRQPVRRTVWAKYGSYQISGCKSFLPNEVKQTIYHYNSGSVFVLELAQHLVNLKTQADNPDAAAEHQLLIETLQNMMTPDGTWRNAHVELFANVKARQNYGLTHLAELLRQELIDEGHEVELFKASKHGMERIEPDGNRVVAELPVEPTEEVLSFLAEPDNEIAEPVAMQCVDPEQCSTETLSNNGTDCAVPLPPKTTRQVIEEAISFRANDTESNRQTKEAMKALSEQRDDLEAERWEATPTVTREEANETMRNPFATDIERIAAQKTFLAESLPDIALTKEFVKKAVVKDRKRWLNAVKNYWRLTHPEETKCSDRKTWIRHLKEFAAYLPFLPDVHTHEPKFQVLRDIGLLDFANDTAKEYSANDTAVREFFETCLKNARKLKTTWQITVTKHSKPIELLNRLLEKIGLRLNPTRHARSGNERTRLYALDEALVNDPDRLATLAALTKRYQPEREKNSIDVWENPPEADPWKGTSEIAEPVTRQGVDPEQYPVETIYDNGANCAVAVRQKRMVRRGQRVRIFATALYPEAIGVVTMGGETILARIVGGEYDGAEWIVPSGDYELLAG